MADSENSKKGQDGGSKSLEEKEKERKGEPLEEEEDRVVQVEKDLSKLKIKEGRYTYCVENTFIYKMFIMLDIVPFDMKCPICQDKRRHPLTLPCGHTFCYLCIKGVYARQKVCALCRQPIPQHCIVSPPLSGTGEGVGEEGRKTCWYYEAKSGGWWEYEERVRLELEKQYQSLETSNEDNDQFVIYISGFPYVVDFTKMIQYRQDKPNRSRRIKREEGVTDDEGEGLVRGVAGIPAAPSIRQQDNN